ncbi:MAG: thiol-disulfide oxidoreductase DCC family protein [Ignavibacteriaceae bacterium]
MINQKQIIIFDGVCNFCNFWVNFVIKRDKNDLFRFTALQSSTGIELLNKYNLDSSNQDTFFLIADNKVYTKSTAAIIVCKQLSGIIKIFYTFIIVPGFIRDFIYDLIAKNRYNLFGKRESCRIPTEEEKKKFL